MVDHSAPDERQATLRLLESLRVELERTRKDLEAKYAAIPVFATAQYLEAAARILAMSKKAVFKFYRDYRACMARMAGGGLFYSYYTRSPDARHNDDPEMAEAVERVNVAARNHDEALLDLHVANLFGGRISDGGSELWNKVLFSSAVLDLLKSVEEKRRYFRSRKGADVQVRSPSKLLH